MALSISEGALRELEALARRAYPSEAFALLQGYSVRGVIRILRPATIYYRIVSASSSHVKFVIEAGITRNPSIVGLWHSHPDDSCELSSVDVATAVDLARIGLKVVGVTCITRLRDNWMAQTAFYIVEGSKVRLARSYRHR